MYKYSLRLIPALLAGLASGQAGAAAFQILDQNAAGLGNAYAGSAATAENASTIFYNPAGLTELPGSNFSGGLTMVQASCKFSDTGSNVGALAGTGNGGDACGEGFIPNAYYSTALTKDVTLGIGMEAPFGLMTDYHNPWVGAAQSLKFESRSVNLNPTIAFRVNDQVSLGFGLDWQKFQAEYTRLAGTFNVGGVASTTGIMARLKASDYAWGWNAGALFKLSPATKLGVSYRSAVDHTLKGSLGLTSDGSPTAVATLAALNAAGGSGPASAKVRLPDMWIFSGTHQLNDRWELLADVARTGWSSIPKVDIIMTANGSVAQTLNLDYHDAWRIALGANYQWSERMKLRFGVAFDQSPTKSEAVRPSAIPDSDRTWLSVGAQWKMAKDSTLDAGLAYVHLKASKINNDQTPAQTGAPSPILDRGVVTGNFAVSAWVLGAQYSHAF